jgi:hypothetical protein
VLTHSNTKILQNNAQNERTIIVEFSSFTHVYAVVGGDEKHLALKAQGYGVVPS